MLHRIILIELSLLIFNFITVCFFSYYVQPKIKMWSYPNKSWSYQIGESYCISLMTTQPLAFITSSVLQYANVCWTTKHQVIAVLVVLFYIWVFFLYVSSTTFLVKNLLRMGRNNYLYEDEDEFKLRFLLTLVIMIFNMLFNIHCFFIVLSI